MLLVGAAPQRSFVVIVNPSNPIESISREELELIYRRYRYFWDDGRRMIPVNLQPGDALRQEFSRMVLRSSASALSTFWNRRYFAGVMPPAVLASPDAVHDYVKRIPGSIGYVMESLVDDSVKVVELLDE